ncbi:hypothetical protein BDV93DRAFT_316073 [Ceratobasidium sp. AG-I]|nr:hypothetical protein BDV93DRAFT_316073 [Ceratobasidium sp. AG-I]
MRWAIGDLVSAGNPPIEDYRQNSYWFWLAGLVRPIGSYYNHCDSFFISALPNRTSASPWSVLRQSFQSASNFQFAWSTRRLSLASARARLGYRAWRLGGEPGQPVCVGRPGDARSARKGGTEAPRREEDSRVGWPTPDSGQYSETGGRAGKKKKESSCRVLDGGCGREQQEHRTVN